MHGILSQRMSVKGKLVQDEKNLLMTTLLICDSKVVTCKTAKLRLTVSQDWLNYFAAIGFLIWCISRAASLRMRGFARLI